MCRLFAVSVDVTHLRGQQAAAELRRLLPTAALVHTYNEAALATFYPVLEAECRKRLDAITSGWTTDHTARRQSTNLAWGFHAEAINLFLQSCCHTAGTSAAQYSYDFNWEHLWVFEDDVGFAGGDLVCECLARYCTEPADLISTPCEPVFRLGTGGRTLGSNWNWAYMGSDAFLSLIPPQQRIKSSEHVQRLSRRLLDALHRLSLGPSSPSELRASIHHSQPLVASSGRTLRSHSTATQPPPPPPATIAIAAAAAPGIPALATPSANTMLSMMANVVALPTRTEPPALLRPPGATPTRRVSHGGAADVFNAHHVSGGIVAWSEMSVPTLAWKLGMRIVTLSAEHIGHIYSYDGRITSAEQWDQICAHPGCAKRLYHALKF